MLPIAEVARSLGLDDEFVIPYGRFKAKVSLDAIPSNGTQGKADCGDGHDPHAGGRGQDHNHRGTHPGLGPAGIPLDGHAQGAVPGPDIRHKGRRHGRRRGSGCA